MSDVIYNISSGFYDSVNGDRLYSAADMNKPYKRVIADGIFPTPQGTPSTDFQVVAVSGMSVAVLAGNAMIGSRWAENTDDVGITIAGNSSSSPRIDSIFLHIDTGMDTRAAGVVYRQGTAAGTPTAPAMVQTDNITELRLADILVAPSAAIITQANITDQRGGSDCPWVAGLIQQVDTSALFDQYRAAYAEQQQNQADEWNTFMDHLSRDYDISMSLRKHESTYTSTAAASLIPINIDGYDTTKDLLQVYINGIFAVEGTHYIVKSAAQIQLTNAISTGQNVHFVIYKAVMGGAQPIIPTDEQVQDAVDAYMDAHPGALVVDPELSDTSTHAIQNKAVTEALAGVNGRLQQVTDMTGFERDIPLSAFGFSNGYGVRHASGAYGSSQDRSAGTNFIPISGAEEIVLTMLTVTGRNSNFGLAFYTGESNDTYIAGSGIGEKTNAPEFSYEVRTIPVPNGANYFRTTWFSSMSESYGQLYDEFSCRIIKSGLIDERIDGIDERIDGIDEWIDGIDEQISASETRISNLEERAYNNGLFKTSASSLLYRRNLPSYYLADNGDTANFDDNEYIQKRMNDIPAGKHFVFVTDTHWDGNKNARKTNDLIQYVRSRIGDVDVVFGGDVLNKNDTKYQAVKVMRSYLNESIDAYGNKFIPAIGNHDVNSVHQWNQDGTPIINPDIWYPPYSVIAPIWLDHLNGRAIFRDETDAIAATTSDPSLAAEYEAYFRFNYHINTPDGTTYIVYNTGAGGPFVRTNFGYQSRSSEIYLHYGWLYDTLMQLPPGNDVVLVGHQSTNGKSDPLSSIVFANVARMMSSFLKKQTTRLYLGTIVENEWVHETYPVYDFSNAPDVGKVFMLQGHWHQDFVVKFNAGTTGSSSTPVTSGLWNRTDHFSKSNGDVPIICTVCDKYNTSTSNNEDSGEEHGSGYVREKDSVTEQAFDVVTITDSGIVTTRFGGAESTDDLRREMIFEA